MANDKPEMVRRVQIAISLVIDNAAGETFPELTEKMALAAIKTMREPTENMVREGEFCPFDCNSTVTWQAMIDEALK